VLNILKDKLDGGYLPYMVKGKSTDGQNVGMLTRVDPIKSLYRTDMKANYPILGSRCGYTGPIVNTEVRKHFITEFEFNNVKIAFISAHLRAIKKENFRCAEREAQANILQSIVYNYINKNYEIILIGDFNDFDAQVLDVNNDKPISQVLDILKGLKGEYAGTYQLQNIAENIVQENRYTDWWFDGDTCNDTNQRYSMIDHILVSDWVKQRITNAFIYHGYDNYCGKYDTDHYPVVIDLVL
jgi:exonuclease III